MYHGGSARFSLPRMKQAAQLVTTLTAQSPIWLFGFLLSLLMLIMPPEPSVN